MRPEIKAFHRARNITETYNAVTPNNHSSLEIHVTWTVRRGAETSTL